MVRISFEVIEHQYCHSDVFLVSYGHNLKFYRCDYVQAHITFKAKFTKNKIYTME